MKGWRLLIVQPQTPDGGPDGDPILVVDSLSAGIGEQVMVTSDGLGTREMLKSNNTPVRWSVLGIVDEGHGI